MEVSHTSMTHLSPGLTQQKLDQALSEWFHGDYTFTHWEYVGDTGKGDSYLSEVQRIKVFGKNKSGEEKYVQIVTKNIPKSISRRKTYRSHEFFKNEINFYTLVLPELLKFQSSKDIQEAFDNYTRIFVTYSDRDNDVIGLEDVNVHGFGAYTLRQEGIDLNHCKVTLKVFARFHAMSFAMRDQQPIKFEEIRQCIFETYYHDRLWGWYERFWKRMCGVAIDAVEKEYPNSIYVEKVREFAVPECYKRMIDAATNTLETGVISHGDSWTNNFLYKYEKGEAIDGKMIDFQLTRCASPVLDTSFFIFACTNQTLRLKHYDELMQYYYDELSSQIKALGTDPDKVYPRKLYMEELKKYSFFGLAFSFESTPFIVLEPEDAINMEMEGEEKLNIDDVWQIGPFKTREGRQREANNVVFCVDRGFI